MRRIAVPLHLDVSQGITDLAQVLEAQFNGSSSDVLPQSLHLGGAGDGYDPGLLREQPRQCDLGWGCLLPYSDRGEQIDQCLICLARFG